MLCPHWGSFDLDHPKITKNGRVFWRQIDSHPVVCKVQVHSFQILKVSKSIKWLKHKLRATLGGQKFEQTDGRSGFSFPLKFVGGRMEFVTKAFEDSP